MPDAELDGRVALVTGVSRRIGIGIAVAERLQRMGATVFATGWPAHDDDMPWGRDADELAFEVASHDLSDPSGPAALVDEVVDHHGRLDIVIAVHARSSEQTLQTLTADELQRSWTANVQSVVLLAQRLLHHHRPVAAPSPPTGRMIWFTSGQHLGPMEGTLAFAISKGALQQMTASLSQALADSRIAANCINPGPVDTGWADDETYRLVAERFPDRRWGTPPRRCQSHCVPCQRRRLVDPRPSFELRRRLQPVRLVHLAVWPAAPAGWLSRVPPVFPGADRRNRNDRPHP